MAIEREFPTVVASDYGFTGFGSLASDRALGQNFQTNQYVQDSSECAGVVWLEVEEDRGVLVQVWHAIAESEQDDSDYNPFRQYTLAVRSCDVVKDGKVDAIMHGLGLLNTLGTVLMNKTPNQLARVLVRNYNFERSL